MIDIIKVKATNTDGQVALWDKDAAHPTGEVFISGDGSVVEVANTSAVRAAIKAGALVEVEPEAVKAPVKQEAPPTVESKTLEYMVDTSVPTISAAIRQEGSKTTKR
jgi:hypothetical protein